MRLVFTRLVVVVDTTKKKAASCCTMDVNSLLDQVQMNLCGLVVNHRTYDLTKTFIESYVKFYPDLPMLIIDNGSHDDSAEYIRSLPRTQFQIIMNDINYGHGYALDQGIIAVNADLVMCFDSDCEIIKGGFIEPMAKAFEDRNLYAIGMFHLVNKGGIDTFIQADPEGKEYPYVHPSTGMYRRSMYLDLPPFRHHGSPCIDNMVEAHRRGYGVVEFPNIRDYVFQSLRRDSSNGRDGSY